MTGSPSNIPTGPKRPGHGRSNLGRAGGRSGGSSERGEASGAAAAVAGMKRKASIDTLREAVTAERPPPSSPETAARRDTVQQRRQSAEAVLAVWGQPLVSPEEHVRVPKSSADWAVIHYWKVHDAWEALLQEVRLGRERNLDGISGLREQLRLKLQRCLTEMRDRGLLAPSRQLTAPAFSQAASQSGLSLSPHAGPQASSVQSAEGDLADKRASALIKRWNDLFEVNKSAPDRRTEKQTLGKALASALTHEEQAETLAVARRKLEADKRRTVERERELMEEKRKLDERERELERLEKEHLAPNPKSPGTSG